MLGIKQIKSDGTIIELDRKHLTLQELQAMVESGCGHHFIEFVHYMNPSYRIGNRAMVVNESGLIYNLPLNMAAMDFISWTQSSPLVGDVVIIEWDEGDM